MRNDKFKPQSYNNVGIWSRNISDKMRGLEESGDSVIVKWQISGFYTTSGRSSASAYSVYSSAPVFWFLPLIVVRTIWEEPAKETLPSLSTFAGLSHTHNEKGNNQSK